MPIEQEPIKIEIPVEEEEVVHVPERRRGGGPGRQLRQTTRRAREAWHGERRQRLQAGLNTGVRAGLRLSRVGLVRGLSWMSGRLQDLAERFTPIEKG